MLKVMLVRSDNTTAMTGSYIVQVLDGWNSNEDAMGVREGKQIIIFSSHEYSEIPPGALLGISNGPMLSATPKNTRLRESIGTTCVAPVT